MDRYQTTLEALRSSILVGVVQAREAERGQEIFTGFIEGGMRALEVSATTPGCFDLIRDQADRAARQGVTLGLGMVRSEDEIGRAHV